MSRSPRVCLVSRRSVEQKVWQASQLEFEDVIAEVDDVDWILPRPLGGGQARRLAHGALNRAGRPFGRDRKAPMRPPGSAVPGTAADLFFAVFADTSEIGMLSHVEAAARRSDVRVAWIVELWTPELARAADYLRQLRGFDHVIVSNRAVVSAVEQISGVPCSYLPLGIDTDRYVPLGPDAPERTVDVASWGRRLAGTHTPLVKAMVDQDLYYQFDTGRAPGR